nr:putative ribonuclease h protein [Quercus suber]
MRVSELIDPVSCKWDQNLLHGLFTPHEVEIIASIPLCLTKEEDVVVWPFIPSGCYTVKSGSKFLAEEQCRSEQSSFTHNDNGMWKMIWGLYVPPKVRNFLWRACQKALHVKYNLKRRHILTEDTCEACKMEVEDIYHALWGCNQLAQLWGSIPSLSFRHVKTFSSIQEVLMFTYEERRNIELMASVMWTIWHRRNQIRTSAKDYPLSQVIHAASQALDTFHDSVSGVPKQSRNSPQTQIRWSPPPAGRIKVNFDGALFKDIRKAGIGVIVRDSTGQAIASLSEQASLPFSPEIAEAMAAARALSFVQDLGFSSFILEGDSANVINTLNAEEKSLSTYGHILSLAKSTNEVYHGGLAKNGMEIAQWAANYLQEYWFAIEVHEMVDSNMVQQPVDREVVAGSAFLQQPVDRVDTDVVPNMLQQPVEIVAVIGLDLMQQSVDRDVVTMPSA